ncbi:fungal-specific transcription factor domain-containing protein [Xylariales sp. PMI_506]|nr:fungal-specific transcription factor domain-containing protein [Xylariales sp. PMI_506]
MENPEPVRWRKPRRVAERDRKRATRACNHCRRMKEKCDGDEPCRRCLRLHRQCNFDEIPARPSTDDRDQVPRPSNETDLEQRVRYLERLLAQHTNLGNVDLKTNQDLAESLDKPYSPPAPVTPRSLTSGSEMIIDEGFTVFPFAKNSVLYSGEFSHWNFSMRIKQWVENSVSNKEANGSIKDSKHKEYYRPDELQSTSNVTHSLASFPPYHVAEFLVQTFFTHASKNYFYVEKNWLLEKLDIIYRHPSSIYQRDVGIICIFFSVFAIGTQYAYLECRDEAQLGSNLVGWDGSSDDTTGVMFYQQACRLIPDVITVASLESVQACLLIGLYLLPLDASGLSCTYLNLSLKLAIQNGMHRKCPEGALDPITREIRNRVWWTVYTIEKRIGIFHGRPMSISIAEVDAELPTDRTDVSHGGQVNLYSNMSATLQLNRILASISSEISLLRTRLRQEGVEPLAKLVDLSIKLQSWWEQWTSAAPQENIDHSSGAISRPDMHLKLEYCLVRMFTGRPFLFPGSLGKDNRSNASPNSNNNSPPCPSPNTNDGMNARVFLATSCVEAALSVIETCLAIRGSIGLARPSYTEFSACRAALLVIIAQCLQEKTARLQDALQHGMSMIREMATGGKSARSEAALIEALERAIARLDGPYEGAQITDDKADYANFKKWEMLWQSATPQQSTSRSLSGNYAVPPLSQLTPSSHGPAIVTRPQTRATPSGIPLFSSKPVLDAVLQPMDDAFPFFGLGSTLQMDEFTAFEDNESLWQLNDI